MADQDIGFEEQLKLEEQERVREDYGDRTYTDADGTVYEWDGEKNAWFPKIDENFIAKYQMNYGKQDSEVTADQSSTDYYSYYQQHQPQDKTGETSEGGGQATAEGTPDGEKKSEASEGGETEYSEEDYQKYVEYYKYYYGDNWEYYMNCDYYNQEAPEGHQAAEAETKEPTEDDKNSKKRKAPEKGKPSEDKGWFDVDETKNTTVYVSGLPFDISEEEYKELMSKCGMIMFDPATRQPKLKLYRDEKGEPKGDGRCCYIKSESVDLALKILDGYNFKDHKLHVERAKFSLKGEYDPSKKRKKLTNKQKKKLKEKQEKLFDWRPERPIDARGKNEKVVVLKSMFDPKEFEDDPTLITEFKEDVRVECSKHGDVKKVTLYDRHPEGVITVSFKEPEEADQCITALNGRWFAQRKISAETWDGNSKYNIEESEAEREERLKKWEKFLETGDVDSKSSDKPTKGVDESSSGSAISQSEKAASSQKTVTERGDTAPERSLSGSEGQKREEESSSGQNVKDMTDNSGNCDISESKSSDTLKSTDS